LGKEPGRKLKQAYRCYHRFYDPQSAWPDAPVAHRGVKNLIAVGSGKGGVGKTTVAVNLAVGLASLGYKTGLMDADVYGPNVPLMMGINRTPMAWASAYSRWNSTAWAHVDGLPEPRRQTAGVARPHAAQRHPAIPARGDWGDWTNLVIDLPRAPATCSFRSYRRRRSRARSW